ncbi:MAG: hypothetical protein IJ329_03345 [Clostridia bacterium]|nr:hypothetical protein [Clostridia bacterium]
MKLVGVKKNIIEKLNGVKVEEDDLYKYVQSPNWMKNATPTEILYFFTELELPKSCYDSVYTIPHETKKEMLFDESVYYLKKILIFLGTEDGFHADYICPAFPVDLSLEEQHDIITKLLNKEQNESYEKKRNG